MESKTIEDVENGENSGYINRKPELFLKKSLDESLLGEDNIKKRKLSLDSYISQWTNNSAKKSNDTLASVPVPLFYCGICLSNHAETDKYIVPNCSLNHIFCKESISCYVSSGISMYQTTFQCPLHQSNCNGILSDTDIQDLVDSTSYLKYVRFTSMKENINYRDCPSCGAFIVGDPSLSSIITCTSCSSPFCFYHSNIHPPTDIACQQFQQQSDVRNKKSEKYLQQISRPCPSCFTPIQKNGGCNHITCLACQSDWCWLCGRVITSSSLHYDPHNFVSGCPGQQFSEAPPFAWWTVFHSIPCCRNYITPCWLCLKTTLYFIACSLVYSLSVVLGVPVGLVLMSIFFLVNVACLPITLPTVLILICCRPDYDNVADVIMAPGLGATFIITGILSFLAEIVWLPIAIIAFPVVYSCFHTWYANQDTYWMLPIAISGEFFKFTFRSSE